MFFLVDLERRIHMPPRQFNAKLTDSLTQRLMQEVEGSFAGRHGFVVMVVHLQEPIPHGELDHTTGFAVFPLKYKALVFRPFKGEVLDSVVDKVTQHGFFADAGPLKIFVSHHLLPPDMGYDAQAECWRSVDGNDLIARDASVRLRILGLKIEATEISATGSVRDDYLGTVE